MNLVTSLTIQGNDDNIHCDAGGPSKRNGKYVGWISLWRNGELHCELLSTEPVFDTSEEAIKYMEDIVTKVRTLKLTNSD